MVSINSKSLPHAQTSTGLPYGSFRNTSGDKYPGVPANPKKRIFPKVRKQYKQK